MLARTLLIFLEKRSASKQLSGFHWARTDGSHPSRFLDAPLASPSSNSPHWYEILLCHRDRSRTLWTTAVFFQSILRLLESPANSGRSIFSINATTQKQVTFSTKPRSRTTGHWWNAVNRFLPATEINRFSAKTETKRRKNVILIVKSWPIGELRWSYANCTRNCLRSNEQAGLR